MNAPSITANGDTPPVLSDAHYALYMRALRMTGRSLLTLGYRFRVEGLRHVPKDGPVLITTNHVTMHDWLFVGAALNRPPRFVMHQHHFRYPALRAFFETSRVIPIAPRKEDPSRTDEAFARIDEALSRGELVVLCPEGTMTPDGRVHEIRPGVERIVQRRAVPVVPAAFSGLFGSFFSRAPREAGGPPRAPMSGWPTRFRAPVTLRFGAALKPHEVSTETLHRRISALLDAPPVDSFEMRSGSPRSVATHEIAAVRQAPVSSLL